MQPRPRKRVSWPVLVTLVTLATLFLQGVRPRTALAQTTVEIARWTELRHEPNPHPRDSAGLGWDVTHHRALVFGGDSGGGLLGDTWLWDGTVWSQVTPDASPAPRVGPSLTWDSTRGTLVLFGGQSITGVTSDTWLWNGTTWVQLHPDTSPPPRLTGSLADASAAHTLVLFGGLLRGAVTTADTWLWDGTTWAQAMPVHNPPPRYRAQMAYDPVRNRVVLYGGQVDFTGTSLGDTWEWDGTDWTQRMPVHAPGARSGAALVWDPVRSRVVLYGGNDTLRAYGDTWEWDGTDWTQRATTGPAARTLSVMTWDPVGRQVLLFSGADRSGAGERDDTWTWDGTAGAWTSRTPPGGVPRRVGMAMTWDAARNVAVMVGGNALMDTGAIWEWNGTTWLQATASVSPTRTRAAVTFDPVHRVTWIVGGANSDTGALGDLFSWDGVTLRTVTPAVSPPARYSAGLVWDTHRNVAVLHGGYDNRGPLGDTWEWDGTTWTRRMATASPPARGSLAMVFDTHRNVTVLFGGESGGGVLGDTWEWDGTTWASRTSSSGVSPPPRYYAAMMFDTHRNVTVLSGGTPGITPLGDTWEWDGDRWTVRSLSVTPAARYNHAFIYDSFRDEGLLYGGIDPSMIYGDTWAYQVRSVATNGGACHTDADCYSMVCTGGVCCDTPCAGTCVSCVVPGHMGTCTALAAGASGGACGVCDGDGGCPFTDAGTDVAVIHDVTDVPSVMDGMTDAITDGGMGATDGGMDASPVDVSVADAAGDIPGDTVGDASADAHGGVTAPAPGGGCGCRAGTGMGSTGSMGAWAAVGCLAVALRRRRKPWPRGGCQRPLSTITTV